MSAVDDGVAGEGAANGKPGEIPQSDRAPRKVMVIGLGNPDRGDDGVGARVAEMLRGRLPAGVAIVARRGDMLALIDDWKGCDALVCIDASAPMGMPGRVRRIDLASSDLPPDLARSSSHAFGVADTIALARSLQLAPREIILYAVEALSFDALSPLTPAVAAAVDDVTDRVVAEVERLKR
jgi:hydrogenase maturation protease